MVVLMHHKLKRCLQQLRASSTAPEIRRNAERQLGNLLLQLVDAKIRHGLCHSDELRQLAEAVLDPALSLEGTGAILLDHFRYRLAHVAMRSRDWILAEQLLNAVLQGHGDLRLARIYQALCSSKRRQLPLDDMALTSLVRDLVAPDQSNGPIPLDLAVQDPVTNMACHWGFAGNSADWLPPSQLGRAGACCSVRSTHRAASRTASAMCRGSNPRDPERIIRTPGQGSQWP